MGPIPAALYSVAQRATVVISQPAQLLGQAAYSELARLVANGGRGDAIRSALIRSTGVAMALSIPALIIIGLASEQIAVLIGGAAFAGAGAVMLLLAVGRAILLIGPPASAALVALGRPGLSVKVNVGTSLLMLPLLPLFMLRWGLIGAGWFSVAQSLAVAVLLAFYVHRELAHGSLHEVIGSK